ncbi:MAG: zinc ABC transporter substrate-binding protein [Microbacteriaceae bacterium]|nr:zinc ABC transporter substrate-binding protein [Microbacteriaceae bacterium]
MRPAALVPALAVALVLPLAGCTTAPDNRADGELRIVASTDVYADLAGMVAPDEADLVAVISGAQDPHEYEATGRVQLQLSRADIVIVNGGGYDDFMTRLLEASGNDDAIVVDAVAVSGLDAGAEGFNEHVWYDYDATGRLLDAVADAVGRVDPAAADGARQDAVAARAALDALSGSAASIAAAAGGAGVIVTEPVPLYLLDRLGLNNLTPPEFSEAIEEDSDVPPALLQSVLTIIGDGSAALVVYNAQTGGPQTDAVIDIATENRVPVIGVTETLPDGTGYLDWQADILNQVAAALGLDPVA